MTAPQLYSPRLKKNTPDPIPGIRDVHYVEMNHHTLCASHVSEGHENYFFSILANVNSYPPIAASATMTALIIVSSAF